MIIRLRVATGEILGGGLLLATGAGFALLSSGLPASTDPGVPGSGGIPFVLGLVIAGLGLIIGCRGFMAADGRLIEIADGKALISAGLLLGCYLFFEAAGFMAVSFVFLFLGFWLLGEADWRSSLAAAAIVAGGLWLTFTKALGVGLPFGTLAEVLFR